MLFSTGRMLWVCGVGLAVCYQPVTARADADDGPAANVATNALNPRFGLFDALDRRSVYNQEFFPQPLLVDDTALERDGELELNWLHTRAGEPHADLATAEVQKSFGLLTLELTVPYQRQNDGAGDGVSQGIGNLELGARYPLWQQVSAGGCFDNTLGVGMEAGIPATKAISINPEFEPKLFDDLKLGGHFSLQSVLGYSTLGGGGGDGGARSLDYGIACAYLITPQDLPLPGVRQFTPMFELTGEKGLNEDEAGQNQLLGSAGFRVDLNAGSWAPSVGLAGVFPVDDAERQEAHWGFVLNLIFEF